VGTLYQKRHCAGMDLRTGSVIQFMVAALATAPLAALFESTRIAWSSKFVFALLWLVLVLSIGAVSLLYVLIRRGTAAQVSQPVLPRPAQLLDRIFAIEDQNRRAAFFEELVVDLLRAMGYGKGLDSASESWRRH
jgi:hypothetical protein